MSTQLEPNFFKNLEKIKLMQQYQNTIPYMKISRYDIGKQLNTFRNEFLFLNTLYLYLSGVKI